jgi:integrase
MSIEQRTAAASPADEVRNSRKLTKTKTPGIFKRGKSYVVIYRAGGKQRKEFARTYDEARKIKRAREADRDRGELQERTTITFRAYLSEWIDRYQGQGRRGFREQTREEYRRLLDAYAHPYFSEKLRLTDLSPRHLAQFVAWLADESQQGKRLSDSSIGNAVIPVRAALATALREGLIRHNPSHGLVIPHREEIEHEDVEEIKALSRDQLAALLAMTPDRYRLLIELLAGTGLRVSEAVALQRQHLKLDGSRPMVRVRHAYSKRRFSPPKTKHGRRDVPISTELAIKLRSQLADLADVPDALVFPSRNGTPLDADNLRARTIKPLMQEIGAPWAGFHSLRHTFASLQLANGCNILQLSRVLGHHSAAFTLSVYTHLLPGDEAPALDLGDVLAGGNGGGNATHGLRAIPTEDVSQRLAA